LCSKHKSRSFISESKMEELLQNRMYIVNENLSPNPQNTTNISICSYNILAQYQLLNNFYLYTHCDKEILDWPARWVNIRRDFERLNCDIFCLQEVQCEHFAEDIEPAMIKLGYKGFFSSKTGKKRDGCAIFVKTDKFYLDISTFETVLFHSNKLRVLSTDNVGQIAMLCPTADPNKKICVANTHLYFNPNHGEIKLAELSLLLSRIDVLSKFQQEQDRQSDSYYFPIVICGDFNSEPNSDIVKFITDGNFDFSKCLASEISGQNDTSFWGSKSSSLLSMSELPPRIGICDQMVLENSMNQSELSVGTGVFSHSLKLQSVYVYSKKDKPRLVTAYTNADTCAVDFIFYRHVNENCFPRLELISYLELLTSDEFFSFGGIPNKYHGSDHIPIVAQFRLHL